MPHNITVDDSSNIWVPLKPVGWGRVLVSVDTPSQTEPPPPPGEGDGTYTTLTGPATCGSMYLHGSGNISTLQTVQNSVLDLGTGSFTVEWWQYEGAVGHSHVRPFYFGTYPTQSFGVSFELGSFYAWAPGAIMTGAMPNNYGQWVHFAMTRRNGVLTIFRNGGINGAVNNTSNIVHTQGLTIGNEGTPGINSQFDGFITNFHIMKACKYLGSFTPDISKPIPPTSKTVFLLDCDDPTDVSKDYVGLNSTTTDGSWNALNPFGF
jgi:hypothetical protein